MTDEPTGRDLTIAAATAAGHSVARIQAATGLSRATVQRARAAHRDWIETERDRIAEEVASGLLALSAEALAELRGLVHSPVDAVRFAACRFVLDGALKWRDAQVIEARLQAVEAAHARQQEVSYDWR